MTGGIYCTHKRLDSPATWLRNLQIMILRPVSFIFTLFIIAKITWCFHIASLNCQNLHVDKFLPDEGSLIKCLDLDTAIVHSSLINCTIPSITEAMTPGWVEIKPGDTMLITPTPEPVTSCLSSIDGNGGVKSITNTDAIYLSAGVTLKVPIISVLFLQYGLTPGIGLRVRLSRIMEYGCTAQPGQTVQILKKFDEYNLTNWKFRPLSFTEGRIDMLNAKGWIPIPTTTVIEEDEIVMCVTDPNQLQCQK